MSCKKPLQSQEASRIDIAGIEAQKRWNRSFHLISLSILIVKGPHADAFSGSASSVIGDRRAAVVVAYDLTYSIGCDRCADPSLSVGIVQY